MEGAEQRHSKRKERKKERQWNKSECQFEVLEDKERHVSVKVFHPSM